MKPDVPPSPLRLKIDAAALAHNWRALDRLSGRASAGAAVKADGYGLGAAQVVPVLAAAGCRDWFVAHWQEVPEVLRHVPAGSVSVLHGPMNQAEIAFARATGVRPVINSLEQAQRWTESGGGVCDLMVDTGMSRLGVPMSALAEPAIVALNVDCCMSHLACADEDVQQNEQQRVQFDTVRGFVNARRYSLANSAGIVLGTAYHADLTRPGIALYGGIPRPELASTIRQVVFPEAAVIQVRHIQPGDHVGYNATFTATAPVRAGIVALGYADGYLRSWSGKGGFWWKGQRLPVIGRVSMDMTIVDLAGADDCSEGDWLSLDYAPIAAAKASGLSQYEIYTVLGRRFARFTEN